MDPTQVAALNGVGMRMLADGALADARATFQRALRQAPGNAVVLNNIGVTLADWRELGGELACFRAAVRADDSLVDAHWNLSQAALSAGLLEEGWREYEWRWAKPDFTSPRPKLDRPLWDGSPLSGRSLLVHAEQGFGDTLQFCRYLMHPRLGGGHLVFQVQPPLLALIRESFPGVDVVTWSAPAPPTDLHVPLMSLPRLVGTTLENIPLVTPRLHPPGEVIRRWESTITRVADNLAIGFVWQGRPTQRKDRSRSLRLALLEDLLRIDGVSWYSLQVGEAARELADAPVTAKVHDLSPLLTDFVETAAAILRLDGVITVDTAVAHLAGALGKDVWVLLSSPADWRWMRERTDSPWYPSVTLIRQTVPGDWSGPVREVASMVRKRIPGGARR
jgi:hypothetical protein